MLYEYAVEPHAIAADWPTCRYLSEKFGFDRGRLIVLYPRKWLPLAIEAAGDLPDVPKEDGGRETVVSQARLFDTLRSGLRSCFAGLVASQRGSTACD